MTDKNKIKIDELLSDSLNSLSSSDKVSNQDKDKLKGEQIELIRSTLENTKKNIEEALELINQKEVDKEMLSDSLKKVKEATNTNVLDSQRIIEGVFNGEAMVSADGKEYNVPANYASKSKLIEGDILKLTIAKNGSFIYKQIGPIARSQILATLAKDEITGDWYAVSDNKRWKLLTASVTYFRGEPGDEIVILVPKSSKSQWAAVENVIKK